MGRLFVPKGLVPIGLRCAMSKNMFVGSFCNMAHWIFHILESCTNFLDWVEIPWNSTCINDIVIMVQSQIDFIP